MSGAGLRQPLPPLLLRIGRQAPRDRPVGDRREARLLQDPQAVQLADRLDDPRQHQVPENLVPARRVLEPQHSVRVLQSIQQVPHPRGRDRQRPAARGLKSQVKLQLARGQPLPGSGLQRVQLGLVVRRAEVLDLARPPPRRVHDLHRRRARLRLHRPDIRHQATLWAIVSAQLQLSGRLNQQVTALRYPELLNPVLSQVTGCRQTWTESGPRTGQMLRNQPDAAEPKGQQRSFTVGTGGRCPVGDACRVAGDVTQPIFQTGGIGKWLAGWPGDSGR